VLYGAEELYVLSPCSYRFHLLLPRAELDRSITSFYRSASITIPSASVETPPSLHLFQYIAEWRFYLNIIKGGCSILCSIMELFHSKKSSLNWNSRLAYFLLTLCKALLFIPLSDTWSIFLSLLYITKCYSILWTYHHGNKTAAIRSVQCARGWSSLEV